MTPLTVRTVVVTKEVYKFTILYNVGEFGFVDVKERAFGCKVYQDTGEPYPKKDHRFGSNDHARDAAAHARNLLNEGVYTDHPERGTASIHQVTEVTFQHVRSDIELTFPVSFGTGGGLPHFRN